MSIVSSAGSSVHGHVLFMDNTQGYSLGSKKCSPHDTIQHDSVGRDTDITYYVLLSVLVSRMRLRDKIEANVMGWTA